MQLPETDEHDRRADADLAVSSCATVGTSSFVPEVSEMLPTSKLLCCEPVVLVETVLHGRNETAGLRTSIDDSTKSSLASKYWKVESAQYNIRERMAESMSLNRVKCSALFAAIAPLLAGCGSADVREFAFDSLDRATQVKYARAVATAFTRAKPLTVAFESGRLARHPREASTMMRLGYVERKNGAYRLTAAGRAASTIRCEYSGGPCADVFVVGRSELVSISTVRFHEGAWPNGADAVVADVELRAIATTKVGQALATSSDLGCKTDNETKPWFGSGTRAKGTVVLSLSQSFYGEYSFASVLDDADTSAGRTLFTSCPSEYPTLPPIIDGWSIEDAENKEKNRL